MLRLVVLSAATLLLSEAQRFALTTQYPGTTCEGQPAFVQVDQVANCSVRDCNDLTSGTSSLVTCTSEWNSHNDIRNLFGRNPYILRDSYNDKNCSELRSTRAFNVAINCVKNDATGAFVLTRQEHNGSITVQYFLDATCSLGSLHSADYISKETLADPSCDASAQKWYMSVVNTRALESMADTSSATNATLGIDSPSTMLNGENTSNTGDEAMTALSTTGTSSSSDESSSTDTLEPDLVINTSEARDRSTVSSNSSRNDDDSGSSSDSGRKASSRSSTAKSRVKITTAPELDTSTAVPSTGSVHENFSADASISGSDTPTTVATAKFNISIGSGTIVGIVTGGLIIAIVAIGSIIRRHHPNDYSAQSHSSDPYWGQTSPINRQHCTQKRY